MLKIVMFVVATAAWAFISRASIRDPRSHGFYRFFAIELILGLVLLNFQSLSQWFGDPFSSHQLVSWLFLVASLVALVPGVSLLVAGGKPDDVRANEEHLIGFERTTRLVITGVYGYIRHPMYASLLFLAWGVLFKKPSLLGLGLTLCATAFLVATGKAEEKENARYFGSAYEAYKKTTKMFVPFMF